MIVPAGCTVMDQTASPTWGNATVAIDFSGLRFHLQGLDAAQCGPIAARFGSAAQAAPRQAPIVIQTGYRDFADPDTGRFNNPLSGYCPVIAYSARGVEVEGLGFRATITFAPVLAGTLCTHSREDLADPFVFENFLRIITAFAVLARGGLLLHSSGIVRDGKAWLFLGRSGAGKTTLARKALATGADILSDDGNVLLPDGQGGFEAGPVPFAGELGQVPCRDQRPAPVAGIFWLHKSEALQVQGVAPAIAYSRVMVCSPTVNVCPEAEEQLHEVLLQLLQQVPVLQLDFSLQHDFDAIFACIRQVLPS